MVFSFWPFHHLFIEKWAELHFFLKQKALGFHKNNVQLNFSMYRITDTLNACLFFSYSLKPAIFMDRHYIWQLHESVNEIYVQ